MENLALQRTVTKLAEAEIKRHNLVGWRFRFNTNKTRLGVCRYDRKTIEVSVHVLPMGLKRATQVVAHELAHAIVGHGHGHDAVWRAKAIALGDTGERCGVMNVERTVVGTCRHCNFTVKRHRRIRGACPKCRHLPIHERMIEWDRLTS
jgi:hypothetical protein